MCYVWALLMMHVKGGPLQMHSLVCKKLLKCELLYVVLYVVCTISMWLEYGNVSFFKSRDIQFFHHMFTTW